MITITTLRCIYKFARLRNNLAMILSMVLHLKFKNSFNEGKKFLNFKLSFDLENRHYKVVARIKDFPTNVRRFFLHFLQFISYSGATLYAREETSNSIHYMVASVNHEGKGFYCEIDFIAGDATEEQLMLYHPVSNENFRRQMEENREMTGSDSQQVVNR